MKTPCQLIKSHELALSEVVANIERARIITVLVAIGQTLLEDIGENEREVRVGAIALLRKAIEKFDQPPLGLRPDE